MKSSSKIFILSILVTLSIPSCFSASVTLDSNDVLEELYADDYFFNQNESIAIKWDISNFAQTDVIHDAWHCLYIQEKFNSPDNDMRVWRISNQDWTEDLSAATYDGLTLQNQTDSKTLNSTSKSTYACFNVTDLLQTEVTMGNSNFSLRIEDLDSLHDGSTQTINSDTYLWFGRAGGGNAFRFESTSNIGGTGKLPLLEVYDYEASNSPPTIDATSEPTDPSTYSSGATYLFKMNATDTDTNFDTANFTFGGTTYVMTNYTEIDADTREYNYTLVDLGVQASTSWKMCINDTLDRKSVV